MDLKKEIKLSDLFRRNGKDGDHTDAVDDSPEEPKARRLFSRTPKEPKAPKEPKEAKEPKASKDRNGRFDAAAKTAPPVPQIPLMRAFDLLPKEHRRQAAERRPGLVQIGVALVAVVVLAALGAFFLMTSSSLNEKRSQREDLSAQLAALKVQAEKPSSRSAPALEEERASRTNVVATALSSRVAWDRLLRDVALVLPDNVYLTALTARSPAPLAAPAGAGATTEAPVHFSISGKTAEQDNVALTLARLSILPELTGVRLVSSQRQTENDDFEFSISATVRLAGATQ
jgi:Tfp pilus assembly protein PilN